MPLYFPTTYPRQLTGAYQLQPFTNKDALLESMACSLLLPKAFVQLPHKATVPSKELPIADIAYFKSASGDMEVIVQCNHIQYEVSLENFYQYSLHGAEKILEKKLLNDNEDKPDILTQRTFPDGQTWITRRTGYKIWNGAGAFVITINATCSLDHYIKYAELIYAITSSLKPAIKPEWELAEPLLMVTRRHPVDFATYIPMSWKEYHHHSDTMEEMNLIYTRTLRETISGIMSMCCIAAYKVGGTEALMKKCQQGYTDQGLDLSNLKIDKTEDLDVFNNVMKGTINVPAKPQDGNKKNNITFYLAKKNNNWIYLEMFGPARDTDFEAWALNDRALEIMKERMVTL